MIVDLASVKARAEALRRHAGGTDYAAQVIADNLVLVAEVERLRGLLLDAGWVQEPKAAG